MVDCILHVSFSGIRQIISDSFNYSPYGCLLVSFARWFEQWEGEGGGPETRTHSGVLVANVVMFGSYSTINTGNQNGCMYPASTPQDDQVPKGIICSVISWGFWIGLSFTLWPNQLKYLLTSMTPPHTHTPPLCYKQLAMIPSGSFQDKLEPISHIEPLENHAKIVWRLDICSVENSREL